MMSWFGRRTASSCMLSGMLLVLGRPADAQSESARAPDAVLPERPVLAEDAVLFEEGNALFSQGRFVEACERFESSHKLRAGSGKLLNLAHCHAQIGKLAEAYREVKEALSMLAAGQGNPENRPKLQKLKTSLEERLAWLTISPPPHPPAALVEMALDGQPVKGSEEIAVVPGEHVISARAQGYVARELRLTFSRAQERRTVAFEALVLEPAHGQAVSNAPSAVARPADVSAAKGRPLSGPSPASRAQSKVQAGAAQEANHGTWRTAALVTGIAGTAISLLGGVWAMERAAVVDEHCEAKLCDSRGIDAVSTGRALVIASTAAFAVGALGFGAWLALPSGQAPQSGQGSSALLQVRGTF